jgi:hypothetical protein
MAKLNKSKKKSNGGNGSMVVGKFRYKVEVINTETGKAVLTREGLTDKYEAVMDEKGKQYYTVIPVTIKTPECDRCRRILGVLCDMPEGLSANQVRAQTDVPGLSGYIKKLRSYGWDIVTEYRTTTDAYGHRGRPGFYVLNKRQWDLARPYVKSLPEDLIAEIPKQFMDSLYA